MFDSSQVLSWLSELLHFLRVWTQVGWHCMPCFKPEQLTSTYMHHVNRLWWSVCCSFCEKLVLSWLMAAWTEDAAYANIEQQYCRAHFSKLAKASEKHYHGLTLVYCLWGLSCFCSLSSTSECCSGEVYVDADWAFCSGILTHWKSQCTVICFTFFFFLSCWKLSVEKVFHPRGALFIWLWSCLNAGLLPVCCCRVGTD